MTDHPTPDPVEALIAQWRAGVIAWEFVGGTVPGAGFSIALTFIARHLLFELDASAPPPGEASQ